MTRDYITLPLADLQPYANNPRINHKAVLAVMESLRECEYISPIVVDEDNCVLAGHTRLQAMKNMGITEEQVLRVTGLTDEQKRKFRILDNRTSDFATWDLYRLQQELDGLTFDGEFDFGFDDMMEALDMLDHPEPEEEKAPAEKKGPAMKFGVRTVPLSREQLNLLYDLYDQYTDAYDDPYGFVKWLVFESHDEAKME